MQQTDDASENVGQPRPAMVRTRGAAALTAEQKELILEGLRAGQSLASILEINPTLPGSTVIHRERRKDNAFHREYDEARTDGMEANIDEAIDYQHAVRGSKQLSIAASKYADTIIKSAALMAPKRFGAMLKVAGADGEKLSIVTVNYGAPAAIALVAETIEAPRLPSAPQQTDEND